MGVEKSKKLVDNNFERKVERAEVFHCYSISTSSFDKAGEQFNDISL